MKARLVAMGAAIFAVACGSGSADGNEVVGSSAQADTEWPDGTYARIRDDGRLYATHSYTDLSLTTVIAAAAGSDWASANNSRFLVMVHGMNEVMAGRCGDAARARYNASGAYCSEFARWVYLDAGLNNIHYCYGTVPGSRTTYLPLCNTSSLSGVRLTIQMVTMFRDHGAFTEDSSMTPTPHMVQPGDYLALTGSSGDRYGHSAIALAVSNDYKWLWLVQGNRPNGCVSWDRIPYFTNGQLNPAINGVGNIDILL